MKTFKISVVNVKERDIDRAFNTILQLLQLIHQVRIYVGETSDKIIYEKIVNEAESIIKKLYTEVYRIRLTPLYPLFKKLQRTAHRLAQKFNKKIKVVVEGADIYVDKKIIEALTDPLVHIVRNAVDHGIEEPSERISKGKDPIGTILIKASRSGPYLKITVRDDGRGIDPEKVIRKAIEKGIFPREKLVQYTWDDVIKALTTPGFSTKEKITEVSGRGVGLDVVKKKVDELGGKLLIRSRLGEGTEITIILPLEASVINCLVVKDNELLWGIPINKVKYVLHDTENRSTIIYEGMVLIPSKLLDNNDSRGNYIVLVEKNKDNIRALRVDEVIGEYSLIVKPVPSTLMNNIVDTVNGIALFQGKEIVYIVDPSRV